jgi:hypothetical protein
MILRIVILEIIEIFCKNNSNFKIPCTICGEFGKNEVNFWNVLEKT